MSAKEPERTRCLFQCNVEWAMWANMNALYAAVIMFIGGVVAATIELISLDIVVAGNPRFHSYGAVTRWIVIAFSMFIFFVEYPRSARRNRGKNVERPGQKYIAPLLKFTSVIGSNYIFRFMIYLLAIVPCIFVLPAIIGAMCLFFACVCYFFAALNGEEWKAPSVAWGPGAKSEDEEKQGRTIDAPPKIPPPRPPQQLKENLLDPPTDAPPPRITQS